MLGLSALADLQQLASFNAVRPYFLLMHVREFGDVARTKEVLDGLGADFSAVQLDMFVKLATTDATFQPYVEAG